MRRIRGAVASKKRIESKATCGDELRAGNMDGELDGCEMVEPRASAKVGPQIKIIGFQWQKEARTDNAMLSGGRHP
jgi:hypothetical protein